MTVRHVFLIRHCVRRTSAEINVVNDADPSAYYSTDPADYLAVPLPNWQAAPMMCTAAGSQITHGVGRYLMETYFPQFGAVDKMRVHFVMDAVTRDVDSAWDMSQGMMDVVRESISKKISIDGLYSFESEPSLFNPTESADGEPSLCTPPPVPAKNKYISERLGTISKPGTLDEIIQLIEKHGGVGSAGSIANLPSISVNTNVSKLAGSIVPIKWIAETAFYSTLSDIPLFSNITLSELLDLVAWINWERYVAVVGNNDAALHGGVMMDRVLRVLRNDANDDEYNQTATFFVGHDGDLNNMATALGLNWDLEPYNNVGGASSSSSLPYAPTPPNTALHFSYDSTSDDNSVYVSVLTPKFFDETDADVVQVNQTGGLLERPVVFTNNPDGTISTKDVHTVFGTKDALTNVLDNLREHLEKQLVAYEGAMDCYNRIKFVPSTPAPSAPNNNAVTQAPSIAGNQFPSVVPAVTSNPVPPPFHRTMAPTITHPMPRKPSTAKGNVFIVWMVFILMACGLVALIRSMGRRRRRGRSAAYTEMGDVRHDLDLEMT